MLIYQLKPKGEYISVKPTDIKEQCLNLVVTQAGLNILIFVI